MPLPFLVVALVGLALGLGWLRLARARGVSPAPMRWSRSRRWTWAVIVALAALWPLWTAWPIVLGDTPYLPGDAASHARVALEIARHGLPHGWIESYSGGFPMGPHYQSA
ncbi:MAG TPA: hypothetical protein VFB62_15755, partial [Polyangiaceae bacterium]|nr:hypothetical protein [Polyangiaceae bacterium]